ncbi:CAP domain-containing protein [Corynebacterium glutamicum]|uniref:CAP domain-containing protein n=1 Tax=Corynebacterium TaxID=1716 RepID=UPI0007216724|nr:MULTISPECIES: CAP domain-containing protein [Corynebacterium]ALP50932.1 hypothetical protein AC079_12435 [Corynebacterium glutamicum]ANR63393.1 hypothetical protein C628_12450 [[Brevibacterium] flavum ZL-1]ANR66398.1 hypothetical protein C627_12330 [Corynebacterium glutamicum ZL-6]ANU34458.1 hypothetical protein BBD29_12225 [Corynebacterium glutamicum]PST74923.1 hypothetical protein I919_12497 [Corynebacterium glutamicum ZL-2]
MEALAAQARTLLERWGVAPTHASFVESIAKAIPILSILLTLIVTVNGISSGNPVQPPALEQVRTDVVNKINYERGNEGLLTLSPELELHTAAQAIAQRNADTISEEDVPDPEGNLVVLQQNLPYANTNADTIVDRFLNSPKHAKLLLANNYEAIGVGVAYKDDRAWIVVEFTQLAGDSVESTE